MKRARREVVMVIRVYGDVTIDNYAFEWPGEFIKAYLLRHKRDKNPVPGLEGTRSRFVARQFGGAYFLARNVAVALTVWRLRTDGKPAEDETGLSKREPWSAHLNMQR